MRRRLLYVLLVFVVLFGGAASALMFVANTAAGTRWALARIDAATGGHLNWAAAEGTLMSGMRIADVAFDDGSSLLQIERLEFAWQPWRLLDGTLVLDRIDIVGLRHQSRVSGEPITEDALRALLFELPVSVELRAFRVAGIVLTSTDGSMTTIESLIGAAALDGDALSLGRLQVRQDVTTVTGAMRLSEALEATGALAWESTVAMQNYAGTLEVGGTLRQLELRHELLQPVQLASRGTLVAGVFGEPLTFDLQHEFAAQSLAAFEQPDLQLQASLRTSGAPDQVSIGGTARATVPAVEPLDLAFALTYRDAALVIDSANVASTQIGLQGSGRLELEPLSLRLDWMLDRLDAGARLPELQLSDVSGTGSLQMTESGESFAGALQLNAVTGTLNGHPLVINGLINAADTGTASLELSAASGANTLDLTGDVGTELALTWSVQAPALDVLWQGLSGAVQGSGNIRGPRDAPAVNGTLGGALKLATDGEVLALDSFALDAGYSAGSNNVSLEFGRLSRTLAGDTTVLLQSGTATLTGTPANHALRGNFSAPQDSLQLSIDGAAADGNWNGTVQDITLASRAGDWRLAAPFALDYTAGALTIAENCWTYLQTQVCMAGGMPAGQGIDAQLALNALPLAWFNSAAPDGKPALLGEFQDAFAANLPIGVSVEGTLDAQVTVRNLQGAGWDSLDVVLHPRALAVEITQEFLSDEADAEPLRQRFGLDVNLSELHSAGNSWAGALDLRVTREEEGAIATQGTLRGSGELAADDTLSGSADLAFSDLGWLEFLVPELRDPVGMLNGTVGISGVRTRPVLRADLRLSEGSFDVPVYGLQIRNASLALATDANNQLRLTGSAQSGEGMLELSADVTNPLQSTRAVTAQVNGANFLAFATDYATVRVSPQLNGSFADEVLTLNGSIEVANTEVDLEEVFGAGGGNAVRVSSDVVIVSGEQTLANAAQQSLPVSADLTVRIGENVHVSGYDLDANLSGELMLEQTPGRPMLVYGELDIPEGRYEIYNQELNARDGRLVFFGNPANPLLDVRAFRETDTGEVGVLLTGNLDSIEGRLYSTPTLPDQEILALLVTGKSFDSVNQEESDALVGAIASFGLGRGEGLTQRVGSTLGLDTLTVGGGNTLEDSALGLGKYLTPDLLMRYKIGLFDRQSVLGIEYTLSERLKLEVESGISQSVDLNYTIEKD